MASLPYPRSLLQQCSPTDFTPRGCTCLRSALPLARARSAPTLNSPTDFTDLHRWLGCVVGSHRIHRIHRSLLLRRNFHREPSGGALVSSAPTLNSPTDFTDLHRWLGCVVGSHRIHRIHRSLLLRRNSHRFHSQGVHLSQVHQHKSSHRFHGFTQIVRLRSGLPQISQNSL